MSLDVYLTTPGLAHARDSSGIFIREDGQKREITRAEWDERFRREPVTVNRDDETEQVYSDNITHNLTAMAEAAGIYRELWRPEEIGITKAAQLIEPLKAGLVKLKANPAEYEKHDAPNGWGQYKNFVPFVENYLAACEQYPDADVRVWR